MEDWFLDGTVSSDPGQISPQYGSRPATRGQIVPARSPRSLEPFKESQGEHMTYRGESRPGGAVKSRFRVLRIKVEGNHPAFNTDRRGTARRGKRGAFQ